MQARNGRARRTMTETECQLVCTLAHAIVFPAAPALSPGYPAAASGLRRRGSPAATNAESAVMERTVHPVATETAKHDWSLLLRVSDSELGGRLSTFASEVRILGPDRPVSPSGESLFRARPDRSAPAAGPGPADLGGPSRTGCRRAGPPAASLLIVAYCVYRCL